MLKSLRLALLEEQAEKRGHIVRGAELSSGDVFALVRDMPYQRASSRGPEVVLGKWRGTCSGKHYLLKELFQELGYETRIVTCTHKFTEENTGYFPAFLRAHLAAGPVPDVHTSIRLRSGDGWAQVDGTWPLAAESLGMRVNHHFQPGVDMKLACGPIEFFEAPADVDPQTFKEKLIESFCGPEAARREQFIEGMGEWLGKHTS